MAEKETVRDWFIGLLVSFGADTPDNQKAIDQVKWNQKQKQTVTESFEQKRQLKQKVGNC